MSTPPPERGAQQRQAILDAALRAIATRGYGGASLAAIAEEAGTTKRMVLYYFESRDRLLLELSDTIARQMVEHALADLDAPELTLGEAAAREFRRTWERLAADPVLLRAYLAVLADSTGDEPQRTALQRIRRAHTEVFEHQLERARAAGIQPPIDQSVLSIVLFATFRGLILELVECGPSVELDRAVDAVASMLHGLFAGQ